MMWNFEVTLKGNVRVRREGQSTIGESIKGIVELTLEHGDNYVGHIIWKTKGNVNKT